MIDNSPRVKNLPDARRVFPGHTQNHVQQFLEAKRLPHDRPYGHVTGFFFRIADRNCLGQRHAARIRGRRLNCRYGLGSRRWKRSVARSRQLSPNSKPSTVDSQPPYAIFDNRSFTRSDNTFPSTVLPSRRAFAALITAPIALGEFAPVSAMAASTAALISESDAAAGR